MEDTLAAPVLGRPQSCWLPSHLGLVRGSSVEKSIECDSNRANREAMLPSYANKTVYFVHYRVLDQNRQAFS